MCGAYSAEGARADGGVRSNYETATQREEPWCPADGSVPGHRDVSCQS